MDVKSKLREFWDAPAPGRPGNPPKMSFPDNGRLSKPVDWTQSNFAKGLQGKFGEENPPIDWGK